VVLVMSLVAANSSRNSGYGRMELSNFDWTPASNCSRLGNLCMGKIGEKGRYSMRKRLEAKGGLGGDEFELLPSSNGGAPARDWSSLAAQKATVSGER
jgi:hypothetical protein